MMSIRKDKHRVFYDREGLGLYEPEGEVLCIIHVVRLKLVFPKKIVLLKIYHAIQIP